MCDTQYLKKHYHVVRHCLTATTQFEAEANEHVTPGDAYRLLGQATKDVFELLMEVERLRHDNAKLKRALKESRAETEAVTEKLDKYVCGEISWLEV